MLLFNILRRIDGSLGPAVVMIKKGLVCLYVCFRYAAGMSHLYTLLQVSGTNIHPVTAVILILIVEVSGNILLVHSYKRQQEVHGWMDGWPQ